jgi:hypothetical protein
MSQQGDILTVEGRHKAPVQQGDYLMGDAIAPVLQFGNPVHFIIDVGPVVEEVFQSLGYADQVVPGLNEQLEEFLFLGNKAQPHGGYSFNRESLFDLFATCQSVRLKSAALTGANSCKIPPACCRRQAAAMGPGQFQLKLKKLIPKPAENLTRL